MSTAAAAAPRAAVHDALVADAALNAPLTLAEHNLVNFRFATADVRREADGRTYHAPVRFRAVTEPA